MSSVQQVILVILDGWGVAAPSRGNAITLARTPIFKKLIATYPTFTLQAAGETVGLPWGEVGNSEVGHLTLGAGKILFQDLPRINHSISDKSFFTNRAFLQATDYVKQNNSALHLIGLVSPGGVHSYNEHLYALLEVAKNQAINNVFVHVILDGRDVSYNSGVGFVEDLQNIIGKVGVGQIATLAGRFYAMDRDNHWDRTQAYYSALTKGEGSLVTDPVTAIKKSYEDKVYDEELMPTVITKNNQPIALVKDNDAVIFFNFRSDRARQLTGSFVLPKFDKFKHQHLTNLLFVTMTEYDSNLPTVVAFPPEVVDKPLAKVLAEAGLKQLHIAETEKYAHVTYFFNGGREKSYDGEDRVLVPSPVVSSYDQKPAMSAREITRKLTEAVRAYSYNFYVANFANVDMVGHTGNLPATIQAVEFLDECLGEVVSAVLEAGAILLITADHGNAEAVMNLQSGAIDKEHSTNPVPLIIIGPGLEHKAAAYAPVTEDLSQLKSAGMLSDVAPTILKILSIPKPSEMTGLSLL